MKNLFTLLFLLYLGSIPYLAWDALSNTAKIEILKGYATFYLTEKDYCAEVTINTEIDKESNTVDFYANCNKVKM